MTENYSPADPEWSNLQSSPPEKKNTKLYWALGIGSCLTLLVCFCCALVVLMSLASAGADQPSASPQNTRPAQVAVAATSTRVRPTATTRPNASPTPVPPATAVPQATRTPAPTPSPVDLCEAYEGIERIQYAIESGNLNCIEIFISNQGVIVAPGNIGLDETAPYTNRDTLIRWLSDGRSISSPSCFGYRVFDNQQLITFTDLAVDWEPLVGVGEFSGITFVLNPTTQLSGGYSLDMVIAERTGLEEYWLASSACRRLSP